MTTDEKRIRIAEACGWTGIRHCGHAIHRGIQPSGGCRNLPDYFRDLNAMAVAITTIPQEKRSSFVSRLADVLIEAGVRNLSAIDYIAAEPEHLAEAFGRTLELW